MMTVSEGINARNMNELNRQVTRQAMATLLRRGIRATVSSGIPLHPAASTVIRAVGQFLGEEAPALPAQSATS
jgi:inactivated superfamily I helicase